MTAMGGGRERESIEMGGKCGGNMGNGRFGRFSEKDKGSNIFLDDLKKTARSMFSRIWPHFY